MNQYLAPPKLFHTPWRLLLAFLLLTLPAAAQLSTATLSGIVSDATGAVVPNASITLVQTDTNFTRKSVSKSDGSYREEFLPVGPYKMTVAAPGFKTLERSGIVLAVMQNAELALTLQVGGSSESISVTADVPLVNLGSSTLGDTVSNLEIDNLPLVNRNVDRLLQLVPGVQNVQTVNNLGYQEIKVLVNGSTDGFVGQVSYYLDGGLNMTGLRNSGNQVPNPDAVSQFNVVTNNYSAQLGRYSSAVVSVVTKSGTNSFHGSAFEFFRDRNFNAIGHNSGVGATKNPYNQHRFGATIGGPIRHNKDFFFGSYGGYRSITYANHSGSLPSDAQLTGDFSENLPTPAEQASCTTAPSAAANTAVHFLVCHPTTASPTLGAGTPTLTPYANNKLPAVDVTAVNIIKFLKANLGPQQPNVPTDTRYTYRTRSPTPEQNEEYLIKTDHQLLPAHHLTLSYFLLNYKIRTDLGGFTQAWSYSNYANKQQNANISEVWTVSPRTVNQFWVNYTRQNGGRVPVSGDPSKRTLADFGSDFGVVGTPSLGQIAVGGVEGFTLSQAITGPKAGTNLYNVRDVLSTTRGHHSLYLGGEIGLEKDFQLTSLNNYGVFSFNSTNGPTGARTTNALSDFLAGIPASMGQDTGLYANANYFNYAGFAQDDWRILPNLTLNIGVRYDVQLAPTDPQSMQTNFTPGAQSHAFGTVNIIGKTGPQLAPVGLLFPGDPGVPRGGVFTPLNHVSPRFGFAYDPYGTGKTVFHGAAGLFFGGISGNEWEFPSNFAPYAVRNTYSKVVSLTHPYQGDPTEFPTGSNPYPGLSFNRANNTATFLPLNQIVAFDPNYRWPYSIQTNFGIQQQFGRSTALSIYYVGSFNRKTPLYNDINGPQFNITAAGTSGPSCADTTKACGYANNSGTVNNRRPLNSQYGLSAANPAYSNVFIIKSNQNSNYHGLQVTVEQRLTHHVSAKGYYSWSKTLQSNTLDSTSGLNGTFVDANYPQLEYHQRSDQDRRHMMTMSFLWKLDYFDRTPHIVRYILGNWRLNGIWTANSGQPFTVTTGTDNYFSGLGNNRPSLIPGTTPKLIDNGRSRVAMMNQWFDTSVYCRPGIDTGCPGLGPLGLLGNTRPATLSNPGYRNVDASAIKDFDIHDALKFELRTEVSNVFNLVNLGSPTASISSGLNFGKISGSGGSQRIIQVGGRILF
ncbi:Carboxypeptidase regulatory-like domain-containing protein [Granulicella pectinivorans]|uniref:Carboxypeptidase regulatory-like domain-containing protein n=1 Tax=Granulicella pectinivorans TaxID=474950 RepID=A0A1I6M159_9BACT|nr:TonB-dependent receptor [Granulicella pectinivorans]SFS09403.1 Carboxypeptidase regulatory-like domain-containing protein [Granulicella pectinivorans]